MEKPILVFQTDFTYKEGAVSSMYGVVKCVDRSLEIFDGTHEIPTLIPGAPHTDYFSLCNSGRRVPSLYQ